MRKQAKVKRLAFATKIRFKVWVGPVLQDWVTLDPFLVVLYPSRSEIEDTLAAL
jgi:hypothetical protein